MICSTEVKACDEPGGGWAVGHGQWCGRGGGGGWDWAAPTFAGQNLGLVLDVSEDSLDMTFHMGLIHPVSPLDPNLWESLQFRSAALGLFYSNSKLY